MALTKTMSPCSLCSIFDSPYWRRERGEEGGRRERRREGREEASEEGGCHYCYAIGITHCFEPGRIVHVMLDIYYLLSVNAQCLSNYSTLQSR